MTSRASLLTSLLVAVSSPALASVPLAEVDEDGVGRLFPAETSGSSFRLGSADPAGAGPLFDLDDDEATPGTHGKLRYWSTEGHQVNYASGKPSSRTVRLHLRPGGGEQRYTWRDGAADHGYLAGAGDLLNFEATVYARVHGDRGGHHSMTWKLRGGRHTKPEVDLASCVGMDVPFGGEAPRAFRELDHPTYDHLPLEPRFDFQLQEDRWVGVKIVSYLVRGGTRNLLYLDTDPFDASGAPQNRWRLYTEWRDLDGTSTGTYDRAATWAGWETTFRVDGWDRVDFALPSAREIVPPVE